MEAHSFTVKCKGIARVLLTPIIVSSTFKNNKKQTQINAIWDTGATSSVISPKMVKECGLIPIGKDKVHTAGGIVTQNVYLINIGLPNGILIESVRVTEAQEIAGADALVGMDIISLGDFAISNFNGETSFTFRIPSNKVFDFVKESNNQKLNECRAELKKSERLLKQHGNEKCGCGSEKKYRYCCGKKVIKDLNEKIKSLEEEIKVNYQ